MIVLFLLHFPNFSFDTSDTGIYQTLAPLFSFLFPFSLGLFLIFRGQNKLFTAGGTILLFAVPILFMVPVFAVQESLPCGPGLEIHWQSISYRLFGIGFHTAETICQ